MSIRMKSDMIIENNPYVNEQINPPSDNRVRMIYDRYHTGKSIILDDLRYLWLKDSKSCEILAKSIVDSIIAKEQVNESDNMVHNGYLMKGTESTKEQQGHGDYELSSEVPMSTLSNVLESKVAIKLILENMSNIELTDMLQNLHETLELQKLTQKMKYWDDAYTDKMIMYTYNEEKKFNALG